MTIFWTSTSFSFYLLMFMNKYFEGSIYLNFYLEGISGILGSVFSEITYSNFHMRYAFIISTGLTLLGAIFILVF